jgi:hypothetical protein
MAALDRDVIARVVAGGGIGTCAADDRVAAGETGKHVVPRAAMKLVVAGGPGEGDSRRGVRLQGHIGRVVAGEGVARMRERGG